MRKFPLLALAVLLLPLPASAAAASPTECQAHLAASIATMTPDRFAEELAGAQGMAGNATPTIKSAAVMLTDLNSRIQDRAAELAALKDQLARLQDVAVQVARVRQANSNASNYLDNNAEDVLHALQANLTARVTLLGTTLESERTALSENLLFHCNTGSPAASASAH